ncbi:phage tail tape measure protein [Rhodococcus zopfii]|uniref:phage tail tape measure protein n=1 Tax=Rhodococcus zopfii TaxID=43772 RepID=UPI0011111D7F|nr:phage tail tape measure protein [Rhodococcus zopfii]
MPQGIELATAYVSILPDTSGLARDLRRDVERAGDRAADGFAAQFTRGTRGLGDDVGRNIGRAGSRAGDTFTDGFTGSLSGIEDSLDGAFDGAGGTAGRAGGNAGGGFLSGFGDSLGGAGGLAGKAGPIGAALAGIGAVGLMAGKELAQAVMDGMQMDKERDLIQARLGVDEATMATIGKAAGAAFSNAWGESAQANMETAQLAIQGGVIDPGDTALEMQPIIEDLNVVNDLIGGEMQQTVRATSLLLKNDLADSAEGAFDLIVRGYQKGGAFGDDLVDTLSEYADGWQNVGFSGEFAMGLISQAMENGVDNTDRVGDAMREFGRRLSEEGDTIKGAISDLGLPADELFGKLKKGGVDGEAAFDRIFDAIRALEDPTERAAAAQAILGDASGDFVNAFTNWDPSAAVASLGQVEGATRAAADAMSGNAASDWAGAMNTIQVEADNVKLALADMATPYLSELAGWVKTHKPEIIGFFTGLVDGALLAGEGIARFVQGALHVIGPFSALTAEAFAGVLDNMSAFAGGAAGVADALGMDGLAADLRGASDFMTDYADKSRSASGAMIEMANTIGDSVIPTLSGMRAGIQASGQQAQDSALLMRALGEQVQLIPDEKRILLKSNTPEQQAALETLGLTVTQLPDGTFQVTANTDEGQRIVDNFVAANNGKNVDVWVTLKQRRDSAGVDPNFVGPTIYDSGLPIGTSNGRGAGGSFATGGYFTGIGTGTSDSNLIRISDGEFITNAAATKEHRPLLEAINNGDFPRFSTGGYFDAQEAINRAKSKAGRPYGYGTLDDCSGHLSDVFNAGTGQSVRFTTASDFGSMGWVRGFDPNGFSIGTNGGLGPNGHMAGTLFGTNIESDGSNGVQYGGSADGATDFPQVWHWPGASGGDDPTMEDLSSGRATVTGIGGLTPMGSGTAGGGFTGGGSGGSSAGSTGKPSDAVSVFVTNWPNGSTTVDTIGSDGTATSSYSTPSATAEGEKAEPNPYEERLRQYGEQMAGIGQSAALEILGVEGTLLDPNHRFWTAGREIAQAFSQRGASTTAVGAGAQTIENNANFNISGGIVDQRIIDEIVRRVSTVMSRNAAPHMGRPF